ncbi:hypothetical protein KPL78_14905 [Roseomonas sp. HJA6]|uniref:Uncharacterized protein n=1 Tax=Roseomonas alba TaxID=2846776 RepID=A0ABS7AA28_9PROT|nr:hypothetical protein [Neoroseomonas alba]MBW6399149.1 hypothetical protein [Neoroseomonas alba]
MTNMKHVVHSVALVSALIGGPVLAQDRVAIVTGSGEGAEVTYVSPNDPRARSAAGLIAQDKAPLVATWIGQGEGSEVMYMEQTSSRFDLPQSAFALTPQVRTTRTATFVGSGESAEVVYTETPIAGGR